MSSHVIPAQLSPSLQRDLYSGGGYLELNPTWHVEDSSWKASQIVKCVQRNQLHPSSVCEIGCGAGEVLAQFHRLMPENCSFTGYEISPQAFQLCEKRQKERLRFRLENLLQDADAYFDLVLAIDVFEHVDDYLGFLRRLRRKGQFKLFHIPLDLSVQSVLRASQILKQRKTVGHLHHFTKETALAALTDTSYEILDCFYTPYSFACVAGSFTRTLLQSARKVSYALNADLTVRVLGGWSLMVLTR
jgi:2-polyprenyl-3-methyl-5-hydroxy-6-metoxy-1,4-benzoquinol methylase